jgi:predicted DNA binding protein
VALRQGYFEVPRECSLAEVAAAVGIDKSTASEILRRGESRVLKRFLLGPD